MYFEELSIEQKTEATINYFKYRDDLTCEGNKEANRYLKSRCFQTRNVCVDGRKHDKKRRNK